MTGVASPNPTSPRRPLVIAAATLVALHGVLAWMARASGITTGNDDAAYLMLARALRHLSYADAYIVGAPVHSQYPPGFPAFLSLLSLGGEHFDVYLAAIVLCSMAGLWLAWDAVRRCHGEALAIVVLALCAVNPSLVRFAGQLMSEAPYMALTLLSVWAVVRERTAPEGERRWPALAIAAACLAALTRSIGVTFLGALFVHWLLERRYRRAAALALAGSLTAGAWIAWTVMAPAKIVGRSYIADATFAGGESIGLAGVLLRRISVNVPAYLRSSIPTILPQPTVPGTSIDNAIGLVVVAVLGIAGVWALWRNARLVVAYLAAYAALLAIWAWNMTRFLVPMVPFMLWALIAGAFLVARRPRWLRPLPYVVAGLIAVTGLARDAVAIRAASACDRAAPRTSPGCYTEVQRGFFAALEHIRRSTPDTAIVASMKEATVGYLTGRRVLMPETADAPDGPTLLADLRARGVDYVLLTPLRISRPQHLTVLLQVCRDLAVEAEYSPVTLLLRVPAPGERLPPAADACEALQRYERENVRWDPEAAARDR